MEIRAPAEQTEGTRSQVLRWLKSIGEPVATNEPLIEIETDKVTVEVASPGAGILREIVKGEQEEIAPGEVLGWLEVEGDAVGPGAEASAAPGSGANAGPSAAGGPGAAGGPSATGRTSAAAGSAANAGPSAAGSHDVAEVRRVGAAGAVVGAALDGSVGDRSAASRLSPAVRRLLSEHALDPLAMRGTGLGGRITVEDVLAAVAARGGSARATVEDVQLATPDRAPRASSDVAQRAKPAASAEISGGSRSIPHTAVRKRIAEHMVQSLLHTAPHVTTVFEVDMTAVLAHREKHREDFGARGVPLTLTAYFLQAIVAAIGVVPEANSRWTDTALEVFDSIHIGVGTALADGGLVVPVLRDVQSLDLFSTAQGLNDLVTRARESRLTPADVRGGTFTISNHGVSGSLLATPIVINQPQAAILGVGKLEKRAVVVADGGADRVVIQPRCYVTLTIDHRVMDGHQANRFMQRLVDRLTNWA